MTNAIDDSLQTADTGLQVVVRQKHPVNLDVTLQCAAGELLALVGPSGSGKSTVLRTIAGLNRADQAHIVCHNTVWDNSDKNVHVRPQQRMVGLVFQEYALFPHKSALENVMLAISGKNRSSKRSKAIALLEKTNMTGLEQRMPTTLSGGQKQRVALARALAREPKVLLLDEPFSAVDQQTRRKLYRELAALRRTLPIPIVLVTHDLAEVQLLADSLSLMHRGLSLQQGSVADVINHPHSREIARLVGHQNLFTAKVVGHSEHHTYYQLGDLRPIEAQTLPQLDIGDEASLLIAPSAITVQSVSHTDASTGDTPGTADHLDIAGTTPPNPLLTGCVQESLVLGDELSIRLHLDRVPKSLRFKLPLHKATAMGVIKGCRLSVVINHEGMHVMAK